MVKGGLRPNPLRVVSQPSGCAPSFCMVATAVPPVVVVGEGPVPSHRPQDDSRVASRRVSLCPSGMGGHGTLPYDDRRKTVGYTTAVAPLSESVTQCDTVGGILICHQYRLRGKAEQHGSVSLLSREIFGCVQTSRLADALSRI